MSTGSRNWQTWCDSCSEYVSVDHAGACAWCTGKVYRKHAPPGLDKYRPIHMNDEVIDAVLAAYTSGHSIRRISIAMHHQTTYASVDSMMNGVAKVLRRRGIRIRSRGEQYGVEIRRRLHARDEGRIVGRRCAATAAAGNQCKRDALNDHEFCPVHEPSRRELMIARATERQALIRESQSSFASLAPSLFAWRDAHGRSGWKITAQRVCGISGATLSTLIRDHQRGHDRYLTPETDRKLRVLLATPPHRIEVAS